MYLVIFLVNFAFFSFFSGGGGNFADFPEFCGSATMLNIGSPAKQRAFFGLKEKAPHQMWKIKKLWGENCKCIFWSNAKVIRDKKCIIYGVNRKLLHQQLAIKTKPAQNWLAQTWNASTSCIIDSHTRPFPFQAWKILIYI